MKSIVRCISSRILPTMNLHDMEITFSPTRNWNLIRTATVAYLALALVALLVSGIGFWLSDSWLLPGWFLAVTAAVALFAVADASWIVCHGYFSGWIDPVDAIGKFLKAGWGWQEIRSFSQQMESRQARGKRLIREAEKEVFHPKRLEWIKNTVRDRELEQAVDIYRETLEIQKRHREQVFCLMSEVVMLGATEYICGRLDVPSEHLERRLLLDSLARIRVESLLTNFADRCTLRRMKEALEYGSVEAAQSYAGQNGKQQCRQKLSA